MADDELGLSEKSRKDATLAPKRPPKFLPSADPKKDEILDKPLFSTTKKDTDGSIHLTSRLSNFAPTKTEMMDCPVCMKPFPAGPERIAHFKSCSKNQPVSGNALLRIMSEKKKTSKTTRTNQSEAAPPLNLDSKRHTNRSRSNQSIKLGSMSSDTPSISSSLQEFRESTPQFTRVADQNEKRRKRPKSFAVVEFAPRSCQCQVLSAIHSRFLGAFKSKQPCSAVDDGFFTPRTDSQALFQRRLAEKTNLYERLADDFSSLFDRSLGADIHITCSDGVIPVHRVIIMARTRNFVTKENTIRVEEPKEIVTAWLRFVYTGRIEWSPGQEDAIVALAQKYGPDTLLSFRSHLKSREKLPDPIVSRFSEFTENNEANASIVGPLDMVESILNRTDENETSFMKRDEDTICGVLDGTNVIDGEDPMQGINISTTFDYPEANITNECMIIEEAPPSEQHTVSINGTVHDEVAEEAVPQSPDVFDVTPENDSLSEHDATAQPWHMTPFYISMNTSSGQKCENTRRSVEEQKEAPQELTFEYPFEEPLPYEDWDQVDAYQSIESPMEHPKCSISFQRSASTSDIPNGTPKSSRHRSQKITPSKPMEIDSFDTSPGLVVITPPVNKPGRHDLLSARIASDPLATSTPNQPPANKKLK